MLYLSPRFKHCFIPLDLKLDYGMDRESVRDFDKTTSLADFGDPARNARLGDGAIISTEAIKSNRGTERRPANREPASGGELEAPEGFTFSVTLPQIITHEKLSAAMLSSSTS